MADGNNNVPQGAGNGAEPEKIYTEDEMQSRIDAAVKDRLARERKKYPTEDELAAYKTWKESQQTEKERWDTLTKERDDLKTQYAEAQARIEQHDRESYLRGKGVPSEDVDYYAYKIAKLVDDKTDFAAAADKYLKENPPAAKGVKVSTGASLNGNGTANTDPNATMNALIRGRK